MTAPCAVLPTFLPGERVRILDLDGVPGRVRVVTLHEGGLQNCLVSYKNEGVRSETYFPAGALEAAPKRKDPGS